MFGEPWFWREQSIAAKTVAASLAPIAFCYERAANIRRRFTQSWRAPAPVICIGNATVGGVGKTPFAIMLAEMLTAAGYHPHILSRGYGGSLDGPVRVDRDKHSAAEVGDEPLLLAAQAPTWVSRKRKLGASAAVAAGADVLIMDDGFQNPTIEKDFSILLVEEQRAYEDLKIFPAGPLREKFTEARTRADLIVEIVPTEINTPARRASDQYAWLDAQPAEITRPVYAFCGIANPQRFYETLARCGLQIAGKTAYPDHYPYSVKDITALSTRANESNAALVTTEKDWVRIDKGMRKEIQYLPVRMRVSNPENLMEKLGAVIDKRRGDLA